MGETMNALELATSPLDATNHADFWSKVDREGPLPDFSDPLVTAPSTPCWVWNGTRGKHGHGVYVYTAGHSTSAHRIAYLDRVGPFARALFVDHLCRRTYCVNPEHLEPVTPRENAMRGNTEARRNSLKTHCKRGHEFVEENTSHRNGTRSCITCNRASSAKHEKRRYDDAPPCRLDGCELLSRRRGLCVTHYNHWRKGMLQ